MKIYEKERNTYQTLKNSALGVYFDGCRDLAIMSGWTHMQVVGYVSYAYEEGFERPIEDLMWQVILFIISAGWNSDWDVRQRQLIVSRIVNCGLDNLLLNIPDDEANLFLHDLKILEIIQ